MMIRNCAGRAPNPWHVQRLLWFPTPFPMSPQPRKGLFESLTFSSLCLFRHQRLLLIQSHVFPSTSTTERSPKKNLSRIWDICVSFQFVPLSELMKEEEFFSMVAREFSSSTTCVSMVQVFSQFSIAYFRIEYSCT